MNPETIILSEVSQKEKDKYCILTHIHGIQENYTEEFIYTAAMEKQTQRQTYVHGERGGEGEMYGKSNVETHITVQKKKKKNANYFQVPIYYKGNTCKSKQSKPIVIKYNRKYFNSSTQELNAFYSAGKPFSLIIETTFQFGSFLAHATKKSSLKKKRQYKYKSCQVQLI